MEAVPKVPMLHFNLKQTQQKASFARLKQYIAECYQEDPETFSKEIYELETLRAAAYNPSIDETGYNVIKRYYCQLHSLQNRFPIENDRNMVNFVWRDIYSNNTIQSTDIRHDMAVVLYNYGAIHTQLGASTARSSEEEMKLVCTLFQRAAWAFETVREKYQIATTGDMYPEILIFMQNICFAQAQECILEKSLIDNRKSLIVAKVASQIIEYYNAAFAALLSGGEEGMIAEITGSRQFKEWRQYIQFKVQYTACILLLYQGQHAEEQQKMGERVTLYQAAFDRLEDARKEAKHLNNMPQVSETLAFVMDVVEAKRKAAKNENEFIYHEDTPELTSIATVAGANCVKGIPFNISDAANEDIFHRLVPIKTHEHSSLYSEEKTNLLRRITQKIDAKDNELNQFMESLNIDSLSYDTKGVKLPQSIIDRCASMNARPTVIDDLIRNMSSLAEICVDVENMLQTIQELLSKEEFYEKDFQQTMGYRPSGHFVELNREFMKYQEAHNKAGDSNDTLRKAMEMHVNNLRILSKPLAEVQTAIPTCSVECDPQLLSDTQMLLNKVNEMRVQRAQLYAQLSENIQKDDITAQLVAWGEEDVDKLFKSELAKHDQLVNIIEQNMVAQENILKTFTDAYAKCAHFIKAVSETKHKRDLFFSSLIASYDVYDDLLGKSLKGLEFYKKLQSNIHKLCARVRSARDVHDEERQQRIDSMNKKALSQSMNATVMPASSAGVSASMPTTEYPKLTKPMEHEVIDNYRSTAIRPTPIGQENTGIDVNHSLSHDASHSNATPSTVAYNYNYQSNVSATMPANYSQQAPAPVTTQSAISSMASAAYSNQQNVYYNATHQSQSSAYAPNSGYVNPIYNNMSTPSPLNQTKLSYGSDRLPLDLPIASNTNTSMSSHASYAANPNVTSSPIGGWANSSYNNAASPQTPLQNPLQNLPVSSHSTQSYSNYSQSDGRQVNSYMNPSYATGQTSYSVGQTTFAASQASQTAGRPSYGAGQTSTTSTFYSQTPQMSYYQTGNPSSVNNPNLTQPQTYSNVSYSDYSLPGSQVSAYQIQSSNQYTQQTQQQTSQVSQAYPHSSASIGYMQTQQPNASSMAYTSYTPGYSIQSMSQNATLPTTNAASMQANYLNNDAYNYYNAQYSAQNTAATNQYYGNDGNLQNSKYTTGYLPSSYSGATNVATNQGNVYNYGVVDPTTGQIPPDVNNYATIQQQPQLPSVQPKSSAAAYPSQGAPLNYSNATAYSNPNIASNQNQYQNQNVATSINAPAAVQIKTEPTKLKATKFDLLSDLDNIPIPAPTLQPIKSIDRALVPQESKPAVGATKPNENQTPKTEVIAQVVKPSDNKPSVDKNDSIEKALAEISLDEDELMVKPKLENESKPSISSNLAELIAASTPTASTAATNAVVPPSSANIENFYKEVQRYEKIINGLTTKTLNGTTPIEIKWKELNDLLDKDANKRTVSVSKLFPEKNRNMLSVPYDHSRVLLPTETDNYINAAHIRDLGTYCNHFILADAPTFNTVKDFWCMIWSQQASHVVCLSTPDEGPILLFPKQLNTTQNFGDYSVTILTEQHRLYIIERSIKVTSSESTSTRIITVLQPKQWPSKNSINNIVGVSQNIIDIVTAKKMQNSPIILNCLTNLERSSLVALTITSILALECDMPIIINVTDVWFRICSQRKNILADMSILQQSMQIVLHCCREFIKKRSPKTLANNTQTNYYFLEEEETPVKDPFKDLDPLWKLKSN